ncbi:MAG: hypothetical protein QXM75_04095 [Candidatus Diapherotrites archaeon]
MDEKIRRSLLLFSLIFVAYFSLIVYLVFFAPGLKFIVIDGKLYLKNESSHMIKNITVETDSGFVVDCIVELLPSQLTRIVLPSERRVGFVIAKAPFHREAKYYLTLEAPTEIITLDFEQENAFAGMPFNVYLNICNRTSEDVFATVSERHDKTFIKGNDKTILVNIKSNGCRKVAFDFFPIKRGNTEVSFVVHGEFFRKEISKNIEIN